MNRKTTLLIGIIISLLICIAYLTYLHVEANVEKRYVRSFDEGETRIMLVSIAQAVIHYRINNDKLPVKLGVLRPDYVGNLDGILGSNIKRRLGLSSVEVDKFPEVLDIIGIATVFGSQNDDEILVVATSLLYGRESVPVLHWKAKDHAKNEVDTSKAEYKVIPLEDVCLLIRKLGVSKFN